MEKLPISFEENQSTKLKKLKQHYFSENFTLRSFTPLCGSKKISFTFCPEIHQHQFL